MVLLPNVLVSLLGLTAPAPERPATPATPAVERTTEEALYDRIGLEDLMDLPVFSDALHSLEAHGIIGGVLAIADMSRPSTEPRLTVIDLGSGKVLLRTWVAHGQATGEMMAEHFSDREGSHQTSLGLYRVGPEIISPKHGPALLLHGLDRGINGHALEREIIMHGADYVSQAFINANGRLGRSWGCPAVPEEEMPRLIRLLADGGLLYVHA
ncbi:MAG: murein L,D-transpeptidase catalytic domain family protein [Flavobacteriales bacterium]|nr:murein L,D-transpeptidase catalytic domain family protein [Flavobacteriales bacterium]MCB9168632.1 murein L,D-transpeptidase catalytic domain family protein [Flavobacteriales bacterium]